MLHANQPRPSADADPLQWNVIALLLGAAFVVILNETTMTVALPVLMTDLQVDAGAAQWLTTGFMLTMAVVIPTTGFIMDRLTTRAVFLTSMSVFSTGTLLAGFSPSFGVLLVARVIQACGTAIMMPLLMTTILVLVPPGRRGQVMGLVSVVISMAPALGPTVAGVVLQFLSWRAIFLVVLPIALGMLVAGAVWMTNVNETRATPIDPVSIVLSALGFGGLVFALEKVGDPDEVPLMAGAFAVSAVALALFVFRQLRLQRQDRPLLDLRAFRFRTFSVSLGVLMTCFMALMGIVLVLPLYLQQVRGLSTLVSGLLLLPGGLVMGLCGPLIGRLHDRFGPRPLVVPAAAVMVAMVLVLARVITSTPVWLLLATHVLLSTAMAFIFTPVFTAGLGALPSRLYAHGSALVGTLQQVAGAAGAALLITVMELTARGLASNGRGSVAAQLGGVQAAFAFAAGIAAVAVVLGLFLGRAPDPAGADEASRGATALVH